MLNLNIETIRPISLFGNKELAYRTAQPTCNEPSTFCQFNQGLPQARERAIIQAVLV